MNYKSEADIVDKIETCRGSAGLIVFFRYYMKWNCFPEFPWVGDTLDKGMVA